MSKNKYNKIIIFTLIIMFTLGIFAVFGIDYYIKNKTVDRIVSIESLEADSEYQAIMIFGAGLVGDNPSPMLKERLDKGIELYQKRYAPIIIMSGDHAKTDHDEVNVMKQYAIDRGIASDDIFMDHAGVSTYDSVYRLKNVFNIDRALLVTQDYHLHRAIYIADSMGLDVKGVNATQKIYNGQLKREIREILARDKDFVKCLLKPSSLYKSDTIEVSLGGNSTNDRPYVSIETKTEENKIEYFVSDKTTVSKIESFLDYEEKEETCDCKPEYTLTTGSGKHYDLEICKSGVHLRNASKEIVLEEDESKLLIDLIEENEKS